ncbi:MAG TPA: BlaI/MecI/CopY family transcriptional regulator, partial [Tepidisphaeraceae bacterium]|nr:BlaI/MecI/CopY family transcriptional regulator [Tepidisphaeraceae bacterium]
LPTMSPKPTEAELNILRVLWSRGPSTVREIADTLNRDREVGYTTVLKLMQIMTEKGLLLRDESNRTHIYRPKFSEERTLQQLMKDLLDRAFGGSAQKLVMQALSAKKTSRKELDEIQKLIDSMKGE